MVAYLMNGIVALVDLVFIIVHIVLLLLFCVSLLMSSKRHQIRFVVTILLCVLQMICLYFYFFII